MRGKFLPDKVKDSMKKLLNVALPVVLLVYTSAFEVVHRPTSGPYMVATIVLVSAAGFCWFLYGICNLGD